MSGAHRRIRSAHRQDQYGPERHSIFVDDKIWLTTRANTCVLIARAWQQATALLNLGENASKADFNAFGHKHNAEALQEAINQAGVPGTIRARMRILGTFTQPNRRASGPIEEETQRINEGPGQTMGDLAPTQHLRKSRHGTCGSSQVQQNPSSK